MSDHFSRCAVYLAGAIVGGLLGLALALLAGCDTSGLDRPPAVCEEWAAMQPSGYTSQKPDVVCVRWGTERRY